MRKRLSSVASVEDVIAAFHKAKKIIVISGAGVSVSCGIPDFRSKDGGLYNTLDCDSIGIPSAELLFDLEYFAIDQEPFYKYCKCLLPKDVIPSLSHRFISLLEINKKLLKNYTQNVDGIERVAGVSKVMECHGTMADFHCISGSCKRKKVPLSGVIENITRGEVCYCPCGEALKPSITFFGEALPAAFFKSMQKDAPRCDLVVVMGTSLKVGGSVHELLRQIAPTAPQVLINRDAVHPPKAVSEGFDVSLLGDCDEVVDFLCARLGWDRALDGLVTGAPDSAVAAVSVGSSSSSSSASRAKTGGSSSSSSSSASASALKAAVQAPSPRASADFVVECVDEPLRQFSIRRTLLADTDSSARIPVVAAQTKSNSSGTAGRGRPKKGPLTALTACLLSPSRSGGLTKKRRRAAD